MKSAKLRGMVFVLPVLAGMLVFFLVPLALSVRYAFVRGAGDSSFVGFQNFLDLFHNPAFSLAVKNTLVFAGVGVPAVLVLSLWLATSLATRDSALRRIMLLPMVMPVAAALMGWSAILGEQGLLPALLNLLGFGRINFLGDKGARWTLIFLYIVKNFGYMTIILSSAIATIPRDHREAFAMDSRSAFWFTIKIVIPQIAPVVFFVIILCIVNCFQIFREVFSLYGFYPPNSLYMIQNFLNNNFLKLNYSRLCTASILVTLAVAMLSAVYLNFSDKGGEDR